MKHLRKSTLIIAVLAALIISSGCENETSPVIGSEVSSSSEISSESSSLPESSSAPEITIEPEEITEPESEPVFHISSNEVQRGSYFIIRAENVDLSDFSFVDFLDYKREFIGIDGGWVCIVPVMMEAEAGNYNLTFHVGDYEFNEDITVTERTVNKQYLVVAPATLQQTIEDAEVRAAFNDFYQKYRWYNTGVKFWEGEFIAPLGDSWYKETTPYGTFRTFSNGKTEWHNATDMGVGGGTPIYATNSGVVLFSDYLGVSGNTVIINHGMGVLSWHYHMSSRSVSVGDRVEKGDFIGRVGTTGLSTGNHLHFGISVGGMFVDPMQMIGSEPDIDFWKESEE